MVAVAERFADGLATTEELEAAHPSPAIPAHILGNRKLVLDGLLDEDAINTAGGTVWHLIRWAEQREQQRVRNQRHPDHGPEEIRAAGERAGQTVGREQCEALRDIVGNPFRPVKIEAAWLTPEVVRLAQRIYDDRAFDRLPPLADALKDAG